MRKTGYEKNWNSVRGAVKSAITLVLDAYLRLMAAGLTTFGLTDARAQLGPLYGGRLLLSNGTNSITLKDTSIVFTNYSVTLPSAQSTASSTQWLQIASTGGAMSWSSALGGLAGSAINYSTTSPQQYASTSDYLFDLQALAPTMANGGANAVNARDRSPAPLLIQPLPGFRTTRPA